MKFIVFDVSNGSCALAVCNNGNSVMFDCGSHQDKLCPVRQIENLRKPEGWLSHMNDYIDRFGKSYQLTKLVVSHQDIDHIKNIKTVHEQLTPYLLHRRRVEDFPAQIIEPDDESYVYYKEKVCKKYRGSHPEAPDWGFKATPYRIPMSILEQDERFIYSKFKNNSSIVYILEHGGFRILIGGDMEEVGWNWLIDNDNDFLSELLEGIDIIIASHHGHQSGYSQKLIDFAGDPKLTILSKGSEFGEETDVDGRYSQYSTGMLVQSLKDNSMEKKFTLTTRSNGNIYIAVDAEGNPSVFTATL